MMKRKLKKELKERRKGGKKTSKRWARGRDRCTHLVSFPWSTDRRAYACPSEELQTWQPFYISNVSLCLSAGVYVLAHVCLSDVQGLCLRCLANYASLLSLCAFESVYAWISSASDPCAKCQISPQSPVRAPFIFTCLLSPYAMKPSPDITKLWQQWPNNTRKQEGGSC